MMRLRVGPRALSEKKELTQQGVKNVVRWSICLECSKGEEAWDEKVEGIIKLGKIHFWYILILIVQKVRKFVTFAICVRTMWYEEKVSNFEIAVAKLKETLRNIKFATLCRSVA